jgi:hypothetical protein
LPASWCGALQISIATLSSADAEGLRSTGMCLRKVPALAMGLLSETQLSHRNNCGRSSVAVLSLLLILLLSVAEAECLALAFGRSFFPWLSKVCLRFASRSSPTMIEYSAVVAALSHCLSLTVLLPVVQLSDPDVPVRGLRARH